MMISRTSSQIVQVDAISWRCLDMLPYNVFLIVCIDIPREHLLFFYDLNSFLYGKFSVLCFLLLNHGPQLNISLLPFSVTLPKFVHSFILMCPDVLKIFFLLPELLYLFIYKLDLILHFFHFEPGIIFGLLLLGASSLLGIFISSEN